MVAEKSRFWREVEDPTGATHDDFRAPAQSVGLPSQRDAAEEGDHVELGELRENPDLLRDLGGELPGGREDQGTRAPAALIEELVEDGQREGCGLAGTGLGQAQDVSAFEAGGNGFFLDGARALEAGGRDAANQRGMQLEAVESGSGNGN
jgi:hypothetical protein